MGQLSPGFSQVIGQNCAVAVRARFLSRHQWTEERYRNQWRTIRCSAVLIDGLGFACPQRFFQAVTRCGAAHAHTRQKLYLYSALSTAVRVITMARKRRYILRVLADLAAVLLLIRRHTATGRVRALLCFGHNNPPRFSNLER